MAVEEAPHLQSISRNMSSEFAQSTKNMTQRFAPIFMVMQNIKYIMQISKDIIDLRCCCLLNVKNHAFSQNTQIGKVKNFL